MSFKRYVAQQFAKPSGFGGIIVGTVMNRRNHPMYEETARLLSPGNSDKILDIGCGNGYVMEMLAKRYDCNYVGIDISEDILRAALKRNKVFVRNGQMSFECCGANRMTLDSAAFDKAYTINTVYFWEDLNSTMAEIKRVLKPNGIFINTLYTNESLSQLPHTQFGYKRFSQKELTDAAETAGFETEITPIIGGAAYSIVCHAHNR